MVAEREVLGWATKLVGGALGAGEEATLLHNIYNLSLEYYTFLFSD